MLTYLASCDESAVAMNRLFYVTPRGILKQLFNIPLKQVNNSGHVTNT
jgi:hypothetical protein